MPLNKLPLLQEDQRLGLVRANGIDFVQVFQHWLGDKAERSGIEILAKYKHTEDYSEWAVALANAEDALEIVGDGIEIIVNPIPFPLPSDRFSYNYRWRCLVKDHSASQNKLHYAFTIVKNYLFPFSEQIPIPFDNELQINQAIWRIDRAEVPIIQNGKRKLGYFQEQG
jgi:hypothetical protein